MPLPWELLHCSSAFSERGAGNVCVAGFCRLCFFVCVGPVEATEIDCLTLPNVGILMKKIFMLKAMRFEINGELCF